MALFICFSMCSIIVCCFAADVKRVWGFEGLRRASVSRVKRRDLWRSNVALYANRRGLFVALCLVDVSKAVEVCAGFGYTSVSVIEALKAVYGRETQATSLRADKPHGLDAQKETNECCGFGIGFLLENRLVLITNPPVCWHWLSGVMCNINKLITPLPQRK